MRSSQEERLREAAEKQQLFDCQAQELHELQERLAKEMQEKKIREVTETVHLSPPYTITIHTLSETKLNLSKYSNGELTALINDVVESGEM